MTKEELHVKEEKNITGRVVHNRQNPYIQISNELIRDNSISPECRWLIIYILSMQDKWNLNFEQLFSQVESHMTRDKLHEVINEAVSAGYIKQEEQI